MHRVWAEFDNLGEGSGEAADELRRATHKTIKAVTEGLEQFRFNTAVARLHEFVAVLRASPAAGAARREALTALAPLIAPFTPHLAEPAGSVSERPGLVAEAPWPTFDAALAEDQGRYSPSRSTGSAEERSGRPPAPPPTSWSALPWPTPTCSVTWRVSRSAR
jgi:leucyl-tRNA synthetase